MLRKWEGPTWDHERPSVVRLLTEQAIIEKLAYVMANPVKAGLVRRARAEKKRLATLSLDTEVNFATPADRSAFTQELGEAITNLVARYHNPSASDGRVHRLVVLAHPIEKRP